MNKKCSIWVLTATCICSIVASATSCSSYDEQCIESFEKVKTHRITSEQAVQNALNFVSQYGLKTRASSTPFTVSEVKAIGVKEVGTRSANDSICLDSLFYVINFDNNMGFVIAASDDRETPIFAYIEEGRYEENDTLNNGYEAFIDALIDKEVYHNTEHQSFREDDGDGVIIGGGGGGSSSYRPDKFEVQLPLLTTRWGQINYSTYCPGDYTGCVVTAVAQICSFLKSPNHVSWAYNGIGNQCYIDWDRIVGECGSCNGNPISNDLKDQIANLMRFWGVAFDAEYGSDGTGVDSDDAISKMRELGYNATGLTDYDATNVMNDLKAGDRIVFMRGNARYYHVGFVFRKYVDGHAWVVDGYIHSIKNNKESLYMHCNWGWDGYRNGYFLSDVLNAEEMPYYDDNANAVTRSSNYRYRLKTSTICK